MVKTWKTQKTFMSKAPGLDSIQFLDSLIGPNLKVINCSMLLLLLGLLLPLPTQSTCPNGCSKNGVCTRNNTCVCEYTHTGADCSLRFCPNGTAWADYSTAVDEAHAMAECSNMGICNRATARANAVVGLWAARASSRGARVE